MIYRCIDDDGDYYHDGGGSCDVNGYIIFKDHIFHFKTIIAKFF